MLDIDAILADLSESRGVFHSEADFQHAVAWQLHKAMPDCQIRLEFNPFPTEHKRMYVDIWLPSEEVAIELKYPTRYLDAEWCGERFALRNQAAEDLTRYDFLKDIQRLERVVVENQAKVGIGILLTNDSSYWKQGRANTVDADFRIHESRRLTGGLEWSDRASKGTTKGREASIRLQGSYDLRWQEYLVFPSGAYRRFRYLTVAVTRRAFRGTGCRLSPV